MEENMKKHEGVKVGVHYKVECFRKGKRIWVEEFDNLVVNVGLDTILDYTLATGSGGDPPWYVGLKDTGSVVAGDTMGSHAGWAELSAIYDEATRPGWVHGSVSGQSVDNSASKAQFTMNATDDVYGCFLTNDNTKGGGAGILYGGGDFAAPRSVQDDDVLNVTVTCTASAS
jgi:hypothetical protein